MGVHYIPADVELAGAENQLINEIGRESILRDKLEAAPEALRLHHHRLPAVARPDRHQRARGRRRGARPAAGGVPRAARACRSC